MALGGSAKTEPMASVAMGNAAARVARDLRFTRFSNLKPASESKRR
jgi:hypothetical protein